MFYRKTPPILRNPQIIYCTQLTCCNPFGNRNQRYNCIKPEKYLFASQTSNVVLPYNQKVTELVTTNLGIGGRIQYGNFYLDKIPIANYLGRYEGQPGGSGTPIRNQF